MKSLDRQIIIILFNILLVLTTVSSQSDQNPLEEFMHLILVSDSIKTNATNKSDFPGFTDVQLKAYMIDLIEFTSMGELEDEALAFADRFFNGTGNGEDHFSEIMSNAAKTLIQ